MKRGRRGGSAAPPAGACGVWLDTAELKQSPVQPLIVKPKVSTRVLGRKLLSVPFTQSRASQPRSKQTSISSFFCRQTDERDKENRRPSPSTLPEDCKEKGGTLAASPVKILALLQVEEEAQKPSCRAGEEKVQAPGRCCAWTAAASAAPLPGSLEAEAQSVSQASCRVGEAAAVPFSFTQDSEGSQVLAHRLESGLFTAELPSGVGSRTSGCRMDREGRQLLPEGLSSRLDSQPSRGANQSKELQQLRSINSLTDVSEPEHMNPAVRRGRSCAAGVYSSPPRAGRAEPLRERSSTAGPSSPCRELFTQDSEGNRVISHRCWRLLSPAKDQGSSLPSSPCKGSSRAAAKRSLSRAGQDWADLCHDLLFTQDSQGNRVIKH
ncbi:aurora kinase A and ninein-interacting protein [Dryobates pubescens]|uniref:aurora kinase A and ninein-interacting protein n=1 Tax=Dryobates pubescens TaxID=118200 RepID=UPI0023B99825|nr:aurora kinase A and ninein-interacting protein [Dryobates pubescens]